MILKQNLQKPNQMHNLIRYNAFYAMFKLELSMFYDTLDRNLFFIKVDFTHNLLQNDWWNVWI